MKLKIKPKIKRETFLQLIISSTLITIIIFSTARVAFASCVDSDACEAISCLDCCKEGYTEYYRCIGNDRQRLWQFRDCRREWKTIERCTYGCSDGYCLCATARAEVSPSTPADRFEEETAYTTIKIHNMDNHGTYFNLNVYLCEAKKGCKTSCDSCYEHHSCDGIIVKNCKEMRCDDNRVYVPAESTRYVKCSRFVKNAGNYRVKVVYSTSNYHTEKTVYSGVFEVRGECNAGAVGDYRCFGKYRQQKYVDEDCDVRWKIVEYCPYGCEGAVCVQPKIQPKLGEPEIFMRTQYELERCKLSSFTFTIRNNGGADTLNIETGGDIANWIDVVPTIAIGKGETKIITAYASVPCDVAPGEHEFIITASGKTTDSRVGVIKIPARQGLFTITLTNDLILIAVTVIVFVVAVAVFKSGFGKFAFGTRKKRKAAEEEFKMSHFQNI